MSRWLKNVGQFLETLDDRAERVVEERRQWQEQQEFNDDEDEDDNNDNMMMMMTTTTTKTAHTGDTTSSLLMTETTLIAKDVLESPAQFEVASSLASDLNLSPENHHYDDDDDMADRLMDKTDPQPAVDAESVSAISSSTIPARPSDQLETAAGSSFIQTTGPPGVAPEDPPFREDADTTLSGPPSSDGGPPPPPARLPFAGPPVPPPAAAVASASLEAVARQAQKEARTWKRQVVTLNAQLERAEAEIQAQRQELAQAASMVEAQRLKTKQDKERERQQQAQATATWQRQQEQALAALKNQMQQQAEQYQQQIRILEQQRAREGGEINQELAQALQREQALFQQVAQLEEDRETMEAHLATLQSQQEALGHRLESLTQTADQALERERQAEVRLDETLSLQAKQLAQRQAREAELERIVSELSAALVMAQGKETRLRPGDHDDPLAGADPAAGSDPPRPPAQQLAWQSLEQELVTLREQLLEERQQRQTLQQELADVHKERSEESFLARKRQQQNDAKVAELTQTLAAWQRQLREVSPAAATGSDPGPSAARGDEAAEEAHQLKALSEEVLKLRDKMIRSNSELSTLKSRLTVAVDRATKAEMALEQARSAAGPEDGTEAVETGGAGGPWGRRRRRTNPGPVLHGSLKAVLRVDRLPGEHSERLGQSLDTLDNFLAQSGKVLRYNPAARLFFVIYLILLHTWTLALIFFHAHGLEQMHGDFGRPVSHGPGALLHLQPVLPAEAAGEVPPPNHP